jgi:hypothetical protein
VKLDHKNCNFARELSTQEKVWILMFKNEHYFWIDQDKIPLEVTKIHKILRKYA